MRKEIIVYILLLLISLCIILPYLQKYFQEKQRIENLKEKAKNSLTFALSKDSGHGFHTSFFTNGTVVSVHGSSKCLSLNAVALNELLDVKKRENTDLYDDHISSALNFILDQIHDDGSVKRCTEYEKYGVTTRECAVAARSLIPPLIKASIELEDGMYLQKARLLGYWLINNSIVQDENLVWSSCVGQDCLKTAILNINVEVAYTFYLLYDHTGDEKFLEMSDKILTSLDHNFRFNNGLYTSHITQKLEKSQDVETFGNLILISLLEMKGIDAGEIKTRLRGAFLKNEFVPMFLTINLDPQFNELSLTDYIKAFDVYKNDDKMLKKLCDEIDMFWTEDNEFIEKVSFVDGEKVYTTIMILPVSNIQVYNKIMENCV